jgi:hypothetical protein
MGLMYRPRQSWIAVMDCYHGEGVLGVTFDILHGETDTSSIYEKDRLAIIGGVYEMLLVVGVWSSTKYHRAEVPKIGRF